MNHLVNLEDETSLEDEVRAVNAVDPGTRARLEDELERLKTVSRKGLGLRLVWQPSKGGPLSGEVKGKTVYIYEPDEEKALDLVRHEFVDYLVTLASEYHKMVSKSLMKITTEIAYLQKEEIVEALLALLKEES